MINHPHPLHEAAKWILEADGLLVTAGAGMGVDSGLPDFRGTDGFWRTYPALGKQGIRFQDIANQAAFSENPRLAWGFYGHRLQLYRDTQPHDGFRILQHLARPMKNGLFVFTSNVDGGFQKAGFPERRISECHGSIHHLQCLEDCTEAIWSADSLQVSVDRESGLLTSTLPTCPHCDALARPNILMFNDASWQSARTDRQRDSVGTSHERTRWRTATTHQPHRTGGQRHQCDRHCGRCADDAEGTACLHRTVERKQHFRQRIALTKLL
jgi:NAD-dependent SIR2 family protein deacetylase